MKFVTAITLTVWLFMAISTMAQPAVLDTDGQPVQSGIEYNIVPGITDVAGGLTIIDRNNSCPLYVGQEPLVRPITSQGISVIFKPFEEGETVIKESRDLTVTFQAATICIQSTSWTVGEEDPESGRRFIVIGGEDYFRIQNNGGVYTIEWCPSESCSSPNCGRPRCGSAGILIENDKRLLVLDGPSFPFQFSRV
ncbi:Kunitz type trypsin inhibitor 104 [Euphorbia peplus]|nr:Kunitz type trypsin inhibitor 104 [Euphorbia peplus]